MAPSQNVMAAVAAYQSLTSQEKEWFFVVLITSEESLQLPDNLNPLVKAMIEERECWIRRLGEIIEMAEAKDFATVRLLLTARELATRLKKHHPPPRNLERGAEIVRLRDVEKKTFGQIPRLLLDINPAWTGPNGKIMSRKSVEKAYERHKEYLANQ